MRKRRGPSGVLKLLASLATWGRDPICGELLLPVVSSVPTGHFTVCTRGQRDKGWRKGRDFCNQDKGRINNTSLVFQKQPVNLSFFCVDEDLFYFTWFL